MSLATGTIKNNTAYEIQLVMSSRGISGGTLPSFLYSWDGSSPSSPPLSLPLQTDFQQHVRFLLILLHTDLLHKLI